MTIIMRRCSVVIKGEDREPERRRAAPAVSVTARPSRYPSEIVISNMLDQSFPVT